MLYNTQMVGASPDRCHQAARRKRSHQATTRYLWTRSNIGALFFLLFFSRCGWVLGYEMGGTVEVVVKVIIMITMTRDVY